MTDPQNEHASRRRRLLLGTGGAALALGAAGPAQAARPTTPTYAISRTRYTTSTTAFLPSAGDTYVVPLSRVAGTDGNQDSTLNADNTVTINNTGTYRVMLGMSWASGRGQDMALRSYGTRRRPAGSPPLTTTAGGDLTKISDTDEHLASEDHPGSQAPVAVRFPAPPDGAHSTGTPFPWTPGAIPVGGTASIDVTMPVAGIVAPGDMVMASLTSIADAVIGAYPVSVLIVRAVVIAPDTVRVSIFNPSIAPSVTVPQGNLQILGFNAQQIRGGSGQARTVLHSSTLTLNKGESIYACFSSLCPGDSLLSNAEVFLQVEKWTQTS